MADKAKRLVPVLFCSTDLPPEMAEQQWIDMRGKVTHDCNHRPVEQDPNTFKALRDYVAAEEDLIQTRMTWLLTVNGFLVASLIFAAGRGEVLRPILLVSIAVLTFAVGKNIYESLRALKLARKAASYFFGLQH